MAAKSTVLRVYLDTSVIGGCFDDEFEVWSNALLRDFRSGRRIRDKQATQFARMTGKQLIAHLRAAGERAPAHSRASRPVRRSRAA